MTGNPPSRGTLPVLVNLTTNERYTLSGPSVNMGRAPENEVILPDDGYASANHARIFWDQGRWWLEDLMSSNGTTVNDQLITGPWQLAPGNVIKVGRTNFRIE
jgi:pSer/pThr/pTyr-binding forkhead associated (FHA) protein